MLEIAIKSCINGYSIIIMMLKNMLKTKRILFGASIFILAIFLAGCAKNQSTEENNSTLPEKESNEETVSPGGLNANGGTSQKVTPPKTNDNDDIKSKLEKLRQGQDSKLNVNESEFNIDDSDIDDKDIEGTKPEENIDDSDIDKL